MKINLLNVLPSLVNPPPRRTIKKGIAGGTEAQVKGIGATWSYIWRPAPEHYGFGFEHVPMIWGSSYDPKQIGIMSSKPAKWPRWLLWNEPDAPASWGQATMTPERAATVFRQQSTLIYGNNPQAQIIVGGLAFVDTQWPQRFRDAYKRYYGVFPKVTGWHIHAYAQANDYSANLWRQRIIDFHNWQVGHGGGELWITEMGCLSNSDLAYRVMQDQIIWLETRPWITRYAWFAAQTSGSQTGGLYVPNTTTMTRLGKLYRNLP